MKKILLLVLFYFASSLQLHASGLEAGAGYAKGSNNDNITFFAGFDVFSNIGLRLEYTKDLSDDKLFSKKDITRYGVFATYTLPLAMGISLTPKAGLVKTDSSFELFEVLSEVSDSSTTFSYGLELNYDYNDNIKLFVGYTDYDSELSIGNIDSSELDSSNVTVGIKISL